MIVNLVKSFFKFETKNKNRRECCVYSLNVSREHGSTFTNSDGNQTVPQSPFPRTNGDNKNSTNTEQVIKASMFIALFERLVSTGGDRYTIVLTN